MADYFTQTVFQEIIPDADMTTLERLLLSHIFQAERDGDGWYFFSEQGPDDMLYLERKERPTRSRARGFGAPWRKPCLSFRQGAACETRSD